MRSIWITRVKELFNKKGLTLIELLAVLVVISILVIIASLSLVSIIEKANSDVCYTNRIALEQSYEMYLTLENQNHNDEMFKVHTREFNGKLCPENGEVTYLDGKVICNVHSGEEHEYNEIGEPEVPYL